MNRYTGENMKIIRYVKVDFKDGIPETEYPARNGGIDPVEINDVIKFDAIRHIDGYDYAIYTGTTEDNTDGVVGVLEVLDADQVAGLLVELKQSKQNELNRAYSDLVGALEVDYPSSERESWHVQVSEANNLDGSTPWIDSAAQQRGVTREAMAELILAQDALYRVTHGTLTGKRQAYRDQINQSTDVVALSKMRFVLDETDTDSD